MPQKQKRLLCTEMNFVLGKNGDYMPVSLGGRSIVAVRQVGRQADEILAILQNF